MKQVRIGSLIHMNCATPGVASCSAFCVVTVSFQNLLRFFINLHNNGMGEHRLAVACNMSIIEAHEHGSG